MIRPAEFSDIEALVELAQSMHHESPRFSRLTFANEKVRALLYRLVQSGAGCVLIAEKNGEICGAIVGMISEHFFSHDMVAQDFGLFISPNKRGGIVAARLVRGFIDWAKSCDAKTIQLGITTGVHVEQTARLYSELGLTECGLLFEV